MIVREQLRQGKARPTRGGSWRARAADDRGAALVEFAFVFPFLIFMFFGIIAFGMVLSLKQAVTQASEEGARAALGVFVLGQPQADTDLERMQRAFDAAQDGLGFLGSRCCDAVATDSEGNSVLLSGRTAGATTVVNIDISDCANTGFQCITVEIAYDYEADPLVVTPDEIPPFSLVVPDTIRATAVLQLEEN